MRTGPPPSYVSNELDRIFRAILERELNLFGNVSDKISGMPGGSYQERILEYGKNEMGNLLD